MRNEFKSKGLKTIDLVIALSSHFEFTRTLIVPNVSSGANIHECDLIILSKSGYATEVEIKVSLSDLKKDKKKKHGHIDKRIKQLYFAVPEHLLPIDEHIPERAGVISVYRFRDTVRCRVVKSALLSPAKKWSEEERYNLARLGSMRIWALKKRVRNNVF